MTIESLGQNSQNPMEKMVLDVINEDPELRKAGLTPEEIRIAAKIAADKLASSSDTDEKDLIRRALGARLTVRRETSENIPVVDGEGLVIDMATSLDDAKTKLREYNENRDAS